MHRVLEPGGRFAILELSSPASPILRLGFRLHMKIMMPLIDRFIAGKSEPFKYLYQTTMAFITPAELITKLEKAGFTEINYRSYLLGGIAIHYGKKSR